MHIDLRANAEPVRFKPHGHCVSKTIAEWSLSASEFAQAISPSWGEPSGGGLPQAVPQERAAAERIDALMPSQSLTHRPRASQERVIAAQPAMTPRLLPHLHRPT